MSDPSNLEREAVPFGAIRDENDAPLDEDMDENAVDSADADERAAREGTKGDEQNPV
ncbi:hypothetical protein [Microbacterium sp. BK668]|uniref:hypothetical protein n=1 Tax=Microbacterium sp. BK668 TaxID=2512118 RepID=UPI0010E9CA59|nr:hypothetical protein [Microbacterium sp. BK668]TDN88577.1 hypothetical protein EV279_3022 [Microbacterium sp. BK668]